jgi:hypothetical protein
MPVNHVVKEPFDVYFVDCPSASPSDANNYCYSQMKEIERKYCQCLFRGVAIDRYEAIVRNYIDVEPVDSVIFADCLEKALEYGDWPKLVLILRPEFMSRSFRNVCATTSPNDRKTIQRQYPTLRDLEDGSLWFSRLPEDDNRFASHYESAYGWYISGVPREALAALVICARADDLGIVQGHILSSNPLTGTEQSEDKEVPRTPNSSMGSASM